MPVFSIMYQWLWSIIHSAQNAKQRRFTKSAKLSRVISSILLLSYTIQWTSLHIINSEKPKFSRTRPTASSIFCVGGNKKITCFEPLSTSTWPWWDGASCKKKQITREALLNTDRADQTRSHTAPSRTNGFSCWFSQRHNLPRFFRLRKYPESRLLFIHADSPRGIPRIHVLILFLLFRNVKILDSFIGFHGVKFDWWN